MSSRRQPSKYATSVGGFENPLEIQLKRSQKLFYKVVENYGAVPSLVSGADALLDRDIYRILAANIIYGEKDRSGRRSRYEIIVDRIETPPDIKSAYELHKRGLTLSTYVYAYIQRTWVNSDGSKVTDEDGKVITQNGGTFLLVKIPIVSGSKADVTRNKRQIYETGDCPLAPGGVIMIKGMWKAITLYNKLKYDMALTYPLGSGEVVTTVTCTHPALSTVKITVSHNESTYALYVHTSSLGMIKTNLKNATPERYSIRAFDYMTVLMEKEVSVEVTNKQIADHILKWIPEEYYDSAAEMLELSYGHSNKKAIIDMVRADTHINISVDIEASMIDDIYPMLPMSEINSKVNQLGYVISRHLLYIIGAYKPHDRDSLSLFRMDSYEVVTTKVLADKIRVALDPMKTKGIKDIESEATANYVYEHNRPVYESYQGIESVSPVIANTLTKLSHDIETAFSNGSFGGKVIKRSHYTYGKNKENQQTGIIVPLNQDSLSQAWSEVTKCGVAANSQGKNYKVRSVNASHIGFLDLFKTPDDAMAGLVRNLAATAWISSWKDAVPIVKYIIDNNLTHDEKETPNDVPIIVNGIIQGWGNGNKVVDVFTEERKGKLREYRDSMFFYDKKRREVIILTDAGRMTRPLLVVKNRKLLIDEMNLWDADVETLLDRGALRYVDAYEIEYGSLIAQYPEYLKHRQSEINKAKEVLNRLITIRDKSTPGLPIVGVDVEELIRSLIGYRVASRRGMVPMMKEKTLTYDRLISEIAQLEEFIRNAERVIDYNYSEIDPEVISGYSAGIIPFLNHNSGTKISYGAHLNTQAMGIAHTNFSLYNHSLLTTLNNGQRPLIETGMSAIIGTKVVPASQNVVMAVISGTAHGIFGGAGQEDAFQIKRSSAERGLLNYSVHIQIKYQEKQGVGGIVRVSRPTGTAYQDVHANLDTRGLVSRGVMVNEGDVVASLETKDELGRWIRTDIKAKPGEKGLVTDVFYSPSPLYFQICLTQIRKPNTSKISTMYGNKGILGAIIDDKDMPYDPITGISPDVIINPIGIIPRGTIGLFVEMIVGAASAIRGQRTNASGMAQDFDVHDFEKVLIDAGLHPKGEYTLIDGRNGRQYRASIAMGLTQLQLLNITIEESSNFKGRVDRNPVNMMPIKGRSKGGSGRISEQDSDAILGRNATEILNAINGRASDGIVNAVCKMCGREANIGANYGVYECTYCANMINTMVSGNISEARNIRKFTQSGSFRHMTHILNLRGIEVRYEAGEQE